MAIVKPFRAIRPANNYVDMVAELPYDVMNREEAKEMGNKNKYSFIHVDRAEIDLDDEIDEHDEKVYRISLRCRRSDRLCSRGRKDHSAEAGSKDRRSTGKRDREDGAEDGRTEGDCRDGRESGRGRDAGEFPGTVQHGSGWNQLSFHRRY